MLKFTKMHGCGNDYVYFNCFTQTVSDPEALSIRLSDRHKGVGGDGIILVLPSETADARMRIFNADGSEAKMCGNGIRCVGKYIYDNDIAKKDTVTIDTNSGIKTLELDIQDDVCVGAAVDMGKAILSPEQIPVNLTGESVIARPVQFGGRDYTITCVSMGNPHCVIFRDGIDTMDIKSEGSAIENDPLFPDRVNTEFIEVVGKNELKMRVWERGSGETLACGTGASAAAVAAVLNGYCEKGAPVTVHLIGGDLVITYTDDAVIMYGPAAAVFDGELRYDQ